MGSQKDTVFDIDNAAYATDEFRIYSFKVQYDGSSLAACASCRAEWLAWLQVERCPRSRPHNWTQCPFAHAGEKAKRRDPRIYKYSGATCPEWRRVSSAPAGSCSSCDTR
jgi:hypothetical protein